MLLVQGVVLTFYAFLGFEDSINVAEELKNPRRDLPLGLVMALVMTVVIYMSVAITAVSVVPWQELAEVMTRAAPWLPRKVKIFSRPTSLYCATSSNRHGKQKSALVEPQCFPPLRLST